MRVRGLIAIVLCFFLGPLPQVFCEADKSTALHDGVTKTPDLVPNMQSVATMESDLQGMAMESDNDWLAEHESNGPAGVRGVPMQRMSLVQLGLVFIVLLGSLGLVSLAGKNNTPDKCQKSA